MRTRWRNLVLASLQPVCIAVAIILLSAGVIAAWIAPRLDPAWPLATALRAPATSIVPDPAGFLGADLTTLGVIIAILIGYNVAAFQIVADAVALGLVRAILLTLIPFIFVWVASSTVTLIYFLA